MPSTSIAQQRLMGQAYALKAGELKSSDLDPKYRKQIEDLAASMSEKDLKDFAETSHKGLPQKVKENYTMNNHIPKFESFVNESVNENYKENYKRFSPEEQKLSLEISNVMWMKFRRMDAKDKINVLDTLSAHIKATGSLQEAIDVKYWADYNDEAGRTFAAKEFAEKSKDFDETFEEAVDDWNNEAEDDENRIKGAQIKKIEKMAQEFFKKAGWISINVVQAMIMQES